MEAEAAACLDRLGLAERLVNGLSTENARWGEEVMRLKVCWCVRCGGEVGELGNRR